MALVNPFNKTVGHWLHILFDSLKKIVEMSSTRFPVFQEDGSSRGSERSSHSENYHDALYEQVFN